MQELYTEKNSRYLQDHPTWHAELSWWKADKIIKMIKRNKLEFSTVVEVGCGAGEILNQLMKKLDDQSIHFTGYEIAPDAYEMCKQRENDRLRFYNEDIL